MIEDGGNKPPEPTDSTRPEPSFPLGSDPTIVAPQRQQPRSTRLGSESLLPWGQTSSLDRHRFVQLAKLGTRRPIRLEANPRLAPHGPPPAFN